MVHDEKAAVVRWRQGQAAAARRILEIMAVEGPRPDQAIAEAQAAIAAAYDVGRWPGPRDPVSERAVEEVRRRWVRIQHHARRAQGR